jgi:hypothetical protein
MQKSTSINRELTRSKYVKNQWKRCQIDDDYYPVPRIGPSLGAELRAGNPASVSDPRPA